ncbi:hypothetical protein BASA81_000120 [Batrachochytrium salamandrivorans]|nr:hypothetical protein BASA81_000120 [Batrachochytrium salamandrivorans]
MFHSFATTREYHDAKWEWKRSLPKLDYLESQLLPDYPSALFDDLDVEFNNKRGVFFSFGTCFYHHRQVLPEHGGSLVGYAKFLVPHLGSVVAVVDDMQGVISGGDSLTKTLEWKVFPGLEFAGQNFIFTAHVTITPMGEHRIESATTFELRDVRNGQLVVMSKGLFVKTSNTPRMIAQQQDIAKGWELTAPLRVFGEHPNDSRMSFVLTLPRQPMDDLPSWWEVAGMQQRLDPKPSLFQGRFELYNVELGASAQSIRAVVWPGLTAEGPPTLVHGGCSATAAIEVLRNLLPDLQLDTHKIRFKRPVPLGSKVIVEWTRSDGGEWEGLILSWDRVIIQHHSIIERTIVRL